MSARAIGACLCLCLGGCASSSRDRAWLSDELRARLGPAADEGAPGRPVELSDGLDEAEVVALTLARSPALRAELSRIDAARATLDEANRPPNPQLNLMGALGLATSSVAALLAPLEWLWQLPARSRAAARDADATAEAVLMRALDLVRDARLLHVELGLAIDRAALRAQLAVQAAELARLAAVRAGLGESGPLEARLFAADAQVSEDASALASTEVTVARARLWAQLALDEAAPVQVSFSDARVGVPSLQVLVARARDHRPDARSAALAISAVVARTGWERSRAFSVGALVEGHWSEAAGGALRLGARVELPLFGLNPGGVGRAEAELLRATAQHEVVARTVVLEVTAARARMLQAEASRARFEQAVLPALDAALAMATHSFEAGDESYLVVLDVLRRAGDARLRRAELVAEQRRARCELERAMGARLTQPEEETK